MPSHRCPVVTLMLVLFTLLCAPALQAQDTPKVEVGIQVTALKLGDFKLAVPDLGGSQRGVGGRVTVNLSDHISVEGEFNTFPNDFRITIPQITNLVRRDITRDRVDQFLLGVKLGGRSEHWGIFGKLRPGYVRSVLQDQTTGNTNTSLNTLFRTTSGFALDVGGVLEFYPSHHTMLRFDLGDTIIRYETKLQSGTTSTKFVNHNLQVSAGFGLRF
ncbi:MAG: porin family protein [Acidobacteria bacterium]|nr:porin family protein [Acidobacteriota bacterium]MBI3422699.1 porin family protein [Acidobacteriota bacterium]